MSDRDTVVSYLKRHPWCSAGDIGNEFRSAKERRMFAWNELTYQKRRELRSRAESVLKVLQREGRIETRSKIFTRDEETTLYKYREPPQGKPKPASWYSGDWGGKTKEEGGSGNKTNNRASPKGSGKKGEIERNENRRPTWRDYI